MQHNAVELSCAFLLLWKFLNIPLQPVVTRSKQSFYRNVSRLFQHHCFWKAILSFLSPFPIVHISVAAVEQVWDLGWEHLWGERHWREETRMEANIPNHPFWNHQRYTFFHNRLDLQKISNWNSFSFQSAWWQQQSIDMSETEELTWVLLSDQIFTRIKFCCGPNFHSEPSSSRTRTNCVCMTFVSSPKGSLQN